METLYSKYKNELEIVLKSIVKTCELELYYVDCSMSLLSDYLNIDELDAVMTERSISAITVAAVWIIDKYIMDDHIYLDFICSNVSVNRRDVITVETDIFNKCSRISKYVPDDLIPPESNKEEFWKEI